MLSPDIFYLAMVNTIVATNSPHAHRCGDICLKCSQAHLRLQDISLQNYFLGVSHVWADPSVRLRTAVLNFSRFFALNGYNGCSIKSKGETPAVCPFRCVLASDFLGRSKLMFPKTMMGIRMASSKSKNHTVSFGRWEWSFKVQMEKRKSWEPPASPLPPIQKSGQCCSSSNPLQTTWDLEASSNEKDILGLDDWSRICHHLLAFKSGRMSAVNFPQLTAGSFWSPCTLAVDMVFRSCDKHHTCRYWLVIVDSQLVSNKIPSGNLT